MSAPVPDTTGFLTGEGQPPWLNLLATLGKWHRADPIERIEDPRRLGEWLATQDLAPRTRPTDADLALARRIRVALRELAEAAIDRRTPRSEAVRTVNRLISEHTVGARLGVDHASGRLVLRRPESVAAALVSLTRTAVLHLTGPEASQLRTCEADDCTRVFLDTTGRRRWCPTGGCGNRARVRAHRERRRETARPS